MRFNPSSIPGILIKLIALIGIWLISSAPAFPQSYNLLQLIPSTDDVTIGRLRLREKRVNGSNYIDLAGPDSLTANIRATIPGNPTPYTLVGLQIPDQTFTERVIFGRAGHVELARFQRQGATNNIAIYETVDNFMTVMTAGPLTFDSNTEIRFARTGSPTWLFADDIPGNGRLIIGTYTPGFFPLAATNQGKVTIYTSEPSTVGLNVLSAAGQSGEVIKAQTLAGVPLWGVRGNGRMTLGNCSGSLQTFTICPTTTTGAGLAVRENGVANSVIQSWTDTFGSPKLFVESGGALWWAAQGPAPLTYPNSGGIYYDFSTQKLKYSENGSVWADLISGGSTLPVIDTTALVFDNGDPTKRVRLEASSISPGITRALTVQNADYILAGTNITNTFSANQNIGGNLIPTVNNTFNIGEAAFGGLRFGVIAAYGIDAAPRSIAGAGYVSTRKMEIWDNLGFNFFWYHNAAISGAGASVYSILDGNSDTILELSVAQSGVVNRYGKIRGDWIPEADGTRDLGRQVGPLRWRDLNMTGVVTGATNLVYNTGNQSIAGNKTFNNDIFLANGVTLGCAAGNGTCNLGVSGSRVWVNAHYVGVGGSVFIASGVDNTVNIGAAATVNVSGTGVYDGTTTCGAGEAITSIVVAKGFVRSVTCSTP